MDQQQKAWLNASYYENVPHNQVNWAALAQQWIAMRQMPEPQINVYTTDSEPQLQEQHQAIYPPNSTQQIIPDGPPIGQGPPPPPLPPGPPINFGPSVSSSGPTPHGWPPTHFGANPAFVQQQPPFGNWPPGPGGSMPPRGMVPGPCGPGGVPMPLMDVRTPGPPFARPPLPRYPPPPSELPYGIRPNQPYYQDQQDYPESYYGDGNFGNNHSQFSSFPGYGNGPRHDMDYRRKFRPPFISQNFDERSTSNSPDVPVIAQNDRKTLPAWIREGLEKVDRERQKSNQNQFKTGRKENQAITFNDSENSQKRTNKFDLSDSESDGEDTNAKEKNSNNTFQDEPPISEEDLRVEMLLLLKKWMTEILLDVTDEQVKSLSREVLNKALKKARPKMLAQSSALAAISSLGGTQDSDSEVDDSRSEDGASDSGTEEKKSENERIELFKRPMMPPPFVRSVPSKPKKSVGQTVDSKDTPIDGQGEVAYNVENTVSEELKESRKERKSRWSTDEQEKLNREEKYKVDKNDRSGDKERERKRKRSRSRERDSRSRRDRSKSREKHSKRSRSKSRERDSKRRSRSKERKHKKNRNRSRSKSRERDKRKSKKE